MILIGDNIFDVYIEGTSTRLSPEAPVPVIKDTKTVHRSGGVMNVWENLCAFGEKPIVLYNAQQVTTKTRVVSNGQIVCRIDQEKYTPYDLKFDFDLMAHSYCIISDYGKGVLHNASWICMKLKEAGIKILVDPKQPFYMYNGAWLIKANKTEFEEQVGEEFDLETAEEHCRSLCDENELEYLIVTLGNKGCFVYEHKTRYSEMIPAESRTVVDVTGAGDVFMAALGHFVQTHSVFEAARMANTLAGISVCHHGTYRLTKDDIAKVKPRVVFTNGCFDILHPGHIQLLNESKKLGSKLIVGLNSNASVKRLKGPNRPILHHDRRKKMLEALAIADEVIIFEEDTPLELIKKIKPDIITKGGDYKYHEVVGYGLAEIVIIPTLAGYSTTGVINEIVRKN